MSIESIRLPNGADAYIGGCVVVATSDAPSKGASCHQAGIHYRHPVGVLYGASQAAAPRDDPSGRICIEVRPFFMADAVVRGGNSRMGSLTHLWEDVTELIIQTLWIHSHQVLLCIHSLGRSESNTRRWQPRDRNFHRGGDRRSPSKRAACPRLDVLRTPWNSAGVVMHSPGV